MAFLYFHYTLAFIDLSFEIWLLENLWHEGVGVENSNTATYVTERFN